jgi:hypothetical protein
MANADDNVPQLTPEEQAGIDFYQARAEARHGERRRELNRQLATYGKILKPLDKVVDEKWDLMWERMNNDTVFQQQLAGVPTRMHKALAESTTGNSALAIPEWRIAIPFADVSYDEVIATSRRRRRQALRDADIARSAIGVQFRAEHPKLLKRLMKLHDEKSEEARQLRTAIHDLEVLLDDAVTESANAHRAYWDWLTWERDVRIERMKSASRVVYCATCFSKIINGGIRTPSGTVFCSNKCRDKFEPFEGVWINQCGTCQRYFAADAMLGLGTLPHKADEDGEVIQAFCTRLCMLQAVIDVDEWSSEGWTPVIYLPGPKPGNASKHQRSLAHLKAEFRRLTGPSDETPEQTSVQSPRPTLALTAGNEATLIQFLSQTPGKWVTLDTLRAAKIGIKTQDIKPLALKLVREGKIEPKGRGGKGSPLSFRAKD